MQEPYKLTGDAAVSEAPETMGAPGAAGAIGAVGVRDAGTAAGAEGASGPDGGVAPAGAASGAAGTPDARHPVNPKVVAAYVAMLVLIPATLVAGTLLGDTNYYLTSALVIVIAMAPFFASFEQAKPQARELVVLAVMCAIAVASRIAFIWLPAFKPMAAIIMISGVALGARNGFMVGAISALVSNFVFSQGPWTPWQMFAFGLAGLVFGLLADRGALPRHDLSMRQRLLLSVGGAAFIVLVLGPILDTCSVFTMVDIPEGPDGAIAIYASGFPLNCVHAAATFVTLFLVGNPLLDKLHRISVKYGFKR